MIDRSSSKDGSKGHSHAASVTARGARLQRLLYSVVLAVLVLVAGVKQARAQSIIKQPGNHSNYAVEIEPHALLGLVGFYGLGVGVGGRVSIPIVPNGFIPKLNNSVAIGFGADFVRYTGCYWANSGCGINSLFFPVVMQWNFFLTRDWSAFGEPGFAIYHFMYDDSWCGGQSGCRIKGATSFTGVVNVGARFHFSDHATLTMRLGFPSLSVGVSFL